MGAAGAPCGDHLSPLGRRQSAGLRGAWGRPLPTSGRVPPRRQRLSLVRAAVDAAAEVGGAPPTPASGGHVGDRHHRRHGRLPHRLFSDLPLVRALPSGAGREAVLDLPKYLSWCENSFIVLQFQCIFANALSPNIILLDQGNNCVLILVLCRFNSVAVRPDTGARTWSHPRLSRASVEHSQRFATSDEQRQNRQVQSMGCGGGKPRPPPPPHQVRVVTDIGGGRCARRRPSRRRAATPLRRRRWPRPFSSLATFPGAPLRPPPTCERGDRQTPGGDPPAAQPTPRPMRPVAAAGAPAPTRGWGGEEGAPTRPAWAAAGGCAKALHRRPGGLPVGAAPGRTPGIWGALTTGHAATH